MAVVMLVMALGLLLQGCACSVLNGGCKDWFLKGDDACCSKCFPGYRMLKECSPRGTDLCTPCEPGTFTPGLNKFSCETCRQCAGALVYVKNCTPLADAQCGCKEGLICGDDHCSFCVNKCPKGQEPTDDGSCKLCLDGTFNDGSRPKCKPWSTKCPKQKPQIVAKGSAFSDIMCEDVPLPKTVAKPETPDNEDVSWLLVIPLIAGVAVMIFIVTVVITIVRSKKNPQKPIIRPPTDDPQTLIAIECSFHEAEQEQGGSSESLDSKESSEQQLIR